MLIRLSPLTLAVLTGCASFSHNPAPIDAEQLAAAQRLVETVEPAQSRPVMAEYLYADSPELQKAVQEFKRTGSAPVVKNAQFVTFPHGEHQPIIYCRPLRACDIQLQAGEEVLNVALGDTHRWIASPAFSGPADNLTPHVIIKPTADDISTNAVITTNRRTYHLGLISRNSTTYARAVRFYYPQDAVAEWNNARQVAQRERQQDIGNLSVDNLNFNYRIDGRAKWRPVRVMDDGRQVYIQMPSELRVTEAPALFVVRNGDDALVNYRVRGDYYVVDRLFDQAALIMGVGRDQERVTIRRGTQRRQSQPQAFAAR